MSYSESLGDSKVFDEETLRKLTNQSETTKRLQYAIEIVTRGIKYIQGYLYDYNISVKRDFRKDPLKIIMEIKCSMDDLDEEESVFKKPKIVEEKSKEEVEVEKDLNADSEEV